MKSPKSRLCMFLWINHAVSKEKESNSLYFSMLLDIFRAIRFHTLNGQREWKWEAYEISCFLFLFLLPSLFSMVDPGWAAGSHGWGRHDCMFRANPNLFLYTVVVMMEMEKRKHFEGWTEGGERWVKVWSRIVEDVQASPDALVPYNVPIPLQQTDAAIQRGTQSWFLAWDPISAPIQMGGIWRECDAVEEYVPFLLILLSHIDVFWAFS